MTNLTRKVFGPVDRSEVYTAIDTERDYQEQFVMSPIGDGGRGYYPTHTLGEFILMLQQYVAQAREKWTHHSGRPLGDEECLHEVRKIAGIAVRCMEQHGAPFRK